MQAKGSLMALKSMENFTRSQKQGYHRPHNDLQNLNKESRSNQCLDFNSTAKPKHNRVLEINVQHRMTCMKTTAKGNKADGGTILGIIISNILVKKVTQVQAEMLSKISVNVMIIFYSNIWRRISSFLRYVSEVSTLQVPQRSCFFEAVSAFGSRWPVTALFHV